MNIHKIKGPGKTISRILSTDQKGRRAIIHLGIPSPEFSSDIQEAPQKTVLPLSLAPNRV